ncbi:MAG: hypothetical protein RLY86_2324 [Pseudomonadota bacterium]
MSRLLRHRFSIDDAKRELQEFETLLASKIDLDETGDVLPAFRRWPNLCCCMALLDVRMGIGDRYRCEYEVGNAFRCDILINREDSNRFLFVELENAKADSIFRSTRSRATPEWSPRFNNGLNQIIDWFCYNDSASLIPQFREEFGANHISQVGLLVIGRDAFLPAGSMLRNRWEWRQKHLPDHKLIIFMMTYDDLYRDLKSHLLMLEAMFRSKAPTVSL